MSFKKHTLLFSGFLLLPLAHATSTTQHVLSESRIHQAELAVTKKARELGRAGSFVLVDRHGDMIASYRMPGALPSTFNFAKSKAETAVALGIATDKLEHSVPPAILTNLMATQGGKYVIFPGGYPVRVGKHLIAGVAFGSTIVSLDSNIGNPDTPNKDADIQCAKAALAVLTGH